MLKANRRPRPDGLSLTVAMLLLTAAAGCDDTSGPTLVPESELEFVPFSAVAPPLETMDTSFWAVKGQDRELRIRFLGQGGEGTGQEFLRFEVEEQTLLRRPNGTAFAQGDSIRIRVTIDPEFYLASFEPTGLEFNRNEPAKLRIEYDEADEEFLGREGEFDMWRQERPGEPWELVGTAQVEELDEIEALLFGFTRFALAIGR